MNDRHPTPALPVVGVIVPCFNQGRYAAECIASLHAQSYPHWRAVLLDDASTDGTSPALCAQLRSGKVDVVLLEKNQGRALVRNAGLDRLPDVDFVLSLDGDDMLTPGYIATLVGVLQREPRVGVAYGTLDYFGSPLDEPVPRTWPTIAWDRASMYLDNRIPGPGAMFRRIALRQTAGWRAEFTHCSGEDYDIWLQVIEAGWQPHWERAARYRYRQHAESFLARATQDIQLAHDLAILRLHAKHIRRAGVARDYVATKLAPRLFTAIRSGDWRRAAHIAATSLACAPIATLHIVAAHYARQLRRRLVTERS